MSLFKCVSFILHHYIWLDIPDFGISHIALQTNVCEISG